MSDMWLGRSRQEWRELWDSSDWRITTIRVLREIAQCPQADPIDRTSALTLWGRATAEGLLPEYATYPQIVRDTLCDIARGTGRVRPKVRREMHERLYGAGCLLDSVSKVFEQPSVAPSTASLPS